MHTDPGILRSRQDRELFIWHEGVTKQGQQGTDGNDILSKWTQRSREKMSDAKSLDMFDCPLNMDP